MYQHVPFDIARNAEIRKQAKNIKIALTAAFINETKFKSYHVRDAQLKQSGELCALGGL